MPSPWPLPSPRPMPSPWPMPRRSPMFSSAAVYSASDTAPSLSVSARSSIRPAMSSPSPKRPAPRACISSRLSSPSPSLSIWLTMRVPICAARSDACVSARAISSAADNVPLPSLSASAKRAAAWAVRSARVIWPSALASSSEKLGGVIIAWPWAATPMAVAPVAATANAAMVVRNFALGVISLSLVGVSGKHPLSALPVPLTLPAPGSVARPESFLRHPDAMTINSICPME